MRNTSFFTPQEMKMFESQNPIFNKEQMKIINRKTPDSAIEVKNDKNGNPYKSVKAAYAKAFVSLITGGNYCFEILNKEFLPSKKEVVVHARLTMWLNEKTIKREQFGQHFLNSKTELVDNKTLTFTYDIGNGYKAAASDAFKKCASEFGLFWDIYGQERATEQKHNTPDISHAEKKKLERLEHFLNQAATVAEIEHTYNTYLETAEETSHSKELLKSFLNKFAQVIDKK